MAALLQHQAVLDLDDAVVRWDKVRFKNPSVAQAPEVILDTVRWIEMRHPRQITVTIQAGIQTDIEPVCTCGPNRDAVCHDLRNEPHFAGCPRWGTPLAQ
jgi:hypothetical protein